MLASAGGDKDKDDTSKVKVTASLQITEARASFLADIR